MHRQIVCAYPHRSVFGVHAPVGCVEGHPALASGELAEALSIALELATAIGSATRIARASQRLIPIVMMQA